MTPRDDDAEAGSRRRPLLAVLPALVLAALLAGSLAMVASLAPPAAAEAGPPTERLDVPLLSIRRDLGPLADEAAERRLVTGLDEVLAGLPADTCLAVDAGDVRVEHRTDDPQVPASSVKILTGVAALLLLGEDHRHLTLVVGAAPSADGVLPGDLHLVGGGDPLLAQAEYAARYPRPQPFSDLRALAAAVAAAGVTRVEGAVVGDESRYDTERYHPAWPPRFVDQRQTGPLSALMVNDGFVTWPRGPAPGEPAPDPAAHAAEVFRTLLEEQGVVVAAGARSGPAPAGAPVLAEHRSPPLREIVGQMLADSDNATAELLAKEVGLATDGRATFAGGADAIARTLSAAGFDTEGTVIVDGSGLAGGNAVDCDLLMDLLDHPPTADAIRDGLAVVGETGTLADRWVGTSLVGRIRAKTGTLNQVAALAGHATTAGAGEATFALVVNVPEPDRVRLEVIAAQQRVAELLVAFPDRPDLAAFEP